MSELDAATLEKFQKFQAMLAESPEIVAALNSPEILALAAKAVEKKGSTPFENLEKRPDVEPDYPVVGYGISDDVSVMSEMTTPTVVTRQSVEEDEYYPEVDSAGKSSSGLGRGPRHIGMNIGGSSFKNGALPPPPPKAKIKNSLSMRRTTRRIKPVAPMSKISEIDGSVTTDTGSSEASMAKKPVLVAKKGNWKPKTPTILKEKIDLPGVGTPTRVNSLNDRNRRSTSKNRGVVRNRSMPNSVKGSSSASSYSGVSEGDIEEDDSTKISLESSTASSSGNKKVTSRVSLSPTRTSLSGGRKNVGPGGITRNRSMPLNPLKMKRSNHSTASSTGSSFEEDDKTNTSNEKFMLRRSRSPGKYQGSTSKESRGRSVPRMRLVPVKKNKSFCSTESSPAKINRSRSSSLTKYKGNNSSDDDNSHASEPVRNLSRDNKLSSHSSVTKSIQSDEESDDIISVTSNTKPPLSVDFGASEHSKEAHSRTRRWRPSSGDAGIPPAFRMSNSSHSQISRDSSHQNFGSSQSLKSRENSFRASGSSQSLYADSGHSLQKSRSRIPSINSEERMESRSDDGKETDSSSDEEEDYVKQTVRKPSKTGNNDTENPPNPEQFKQYLTEITQVIEVQGGTCRPGDYLGGSPFIATRKKRDSSKKNPIVNSTDSGGPNPNPRPTEWLESGKTQKRTWKVKGT